MNKIKVLIVDDTVIYRKIIADALATIPGVEVVGTAHNGKIGLSKIKTLNPDVITLDIEMPEMNGIQVLEALKEQPNPPKTIMLSSLTQEGSVMTIRALELGAFDFIPKPEDGKMAENLEKVKNAIVPVIKTIQRQIQLKTPAIKNKPPAATPSVPTKQVISKRLPSSKSEIVGIGISTGGPNALSQMIPMLPANLNVPVLIVQHMPPMFTASLAASLDKKSSLSIKEAEDGEKILPGTVYIAPGGKQMKIVADADGISRKIKITDDPPENSCKPAVDYLFRSIAQHYVGRSTGVIMTGMGSDGTKGLVKIKENGGLVIAQEEKSCTVYGMPKEPIESGLADVVVPLSRIAGEIVKTVKL